ncbi:MAG: hypothetical protein KAU62_16035 [Candidatus Heimdallarchaeota archaeon]|nr:hypothetical protein [Candidatus Heimdallarchaeota archaeon]MCK4612666.1 hypothetical protein [Candidatus Heimdallarchaeota archaeon]
MSIEEVQNLKPNPKIKTPPWISAVLALVYTVTLVFLLLTSMESAFDFVEDFFKQMPNGVWFFEVPIPIICALLVYYGAQHSQKRSLNILVFTSSALGIVAIGIGVYFILDKYSIILNNSEADFIFFLILLATSLIIAIGFIFVMKFIRKKKTLQ